MYEVKLENRKWSHYNNNGIEIYLFGNIHYEGVTVDSSLGMSRLLYRYCNFKKREFGWIKNNLLVNASGNFSFILKYEEILIVTVDIIRSKPLYLHKEKDKIIIKENLADIVYHKKVDYFGLQQLILSLFVIGDGNIYPEIKSLQAAEYIEIVNGTITSERYFTYDIDKYDKLKLNEAQLSKKIDYKLLSVFRKTLKSVNRVRNWIVPLSGGHDSRLIVNYLN